MIWAKITPCMQNGKSCIVDRMPTEVGFGSTEFHVIRKRNNNVYMPFIWSIFSNENVLKAAQAVFSGSAGQQRVSASFLEMFPAVLPQYDEQVKLVTNLERTLESMNKKLSKAEMLFADMSKYIHTDVYKRQLFAECKWTNEKVDLGVLETLVGRCELFHYKKKHFYLFAKTGFTKGCMDQAAEMDNVTLICFDEMLKV